MLGGVLERDQHVGLDEVGDRRAGRRRADLDRDEEVARLDDRAAVEEHELHAERVGDRAREHGLAAALRTVEQDVEAALEQDLQLLRHDRIEVDALDPERRARDELDLDAAAVVALGLVDRDDLHQARHAGDDPLVVRQDDLRRAAAVEVGRAKLERGALGRVRPERRFDGAPRHELVDGPLPGIAVYS